MKLLENVFKEKKYKRVKIKLIDNEIAAATYLEKLIDTKTVNSLDFIVLNIKSLADNNFKLLSLIKTNKDTKQIPVVVLSNSNVAHDINTSYKLHANCYLQKPVALQDYVNTILSIRNFWMNSEVLTLPNKF